MYIKQYLKKQTLKLPHNVSHGWTEERTFRVASLLKFYHSFYVKPEDKKRSMRDKFQKIISEGEKRGKALKVKLLTIGDLKG